MTALPELEVMMKGDSPNPIPVMRAQRTVSSGLRLMKEIEQAV
jgi:hypothetical protein